MNHSIPPASLQTGGGLPEARLLELAANRNTVREALDLLERARGPGEVTDEEQRIVATVLARGGGLMQAATEQGWREEMLEVFTRIEQVALVWEDIGWQARAPGYACVLLTQLHRAQEALETAGRCWEVVIKHRSAVLGKMLREVLIAMASSWHETIGHNLAREQIPQTLELLARTATLAGQLGAEKLQAVVLGICAELCMQTPGRVLEAVQMIEKGWHLMTLDETDEKMWNNMHLLARGAAEHLQELIEKQVDQGHLAAARDLTRLLVRLERSHPDQKRLAEALATLAQLCEENEITLASAREARHLAAAYGLEEIVQGMDSLLATGTTK